MQGPRNDMLIENHYLLSGNYPYHSSYLKIVALVKEIENDLNGDIIQPSNSSSEKRPLFAFETNPSVLISFSNSEKYKYDNIFLDVSQLYDTEIKSLISKRQDSMVILYGPTSKDIIFQKILELITKDIFIEKPQVQISCNMIVNNEIFDLIQMTKLFNLNISYTDIMDEESFNQLLLQALNNRVNSIQNNIANHLYISIIIENKNESRERAVDNFFEINLLSLDFYNDFYNTLHDLGESIISSVKKEKINNKEGRSLLSCTVKNKLNSNIVLVNCLDYYAITEQIASMNEKANTYVKWIKDSILLKRQNKEQNEKDNIDDFENEKYEIGEDSLNHSMPQKESLRDMIKNKFYNQVNNRFNSNSNYLNQNDNIPINSQEESKFKMLNQSPNKRRIDELSNSINQVNNKSEILRRGFDNFHDLNNNNAINKTFTSPVRLNIATFNNNPQNTSQVAFELQKAKHNKSTLISDNIIFRADINRLTDLNRHLEEEISSQRQRNYDLANENDKLSKQNISLHLEIEKTNELINQVRVKDQDFMENLNECILLENKTQSNGYEINKIKEDITKKTMDYALLLDKYNTLSSKNSQTESELNLLRNVQNEQILAIEEKLNVMIQDISALRRENEYLRDEKEKYRNDLTKMQSLRDGFREKFKEQKLSNDILNEKLNDIQKEFTLYKNELEESELNKLRELEIRKSKLESKNKIVNELQKRIANYKNERLKNKDKREEIKNNE